MTDPSAQSEVRQRAGISPFAGCLISLLIGAAGVACLGVVLQLTLRGDIYLGRGSPNETRVWLVREDANQGLGLSTSRVATRDGGGHPACVESRIRFILWRSDGSAQAITYCDCSLTGGEGHIDGPCERAIP